MSDYIINPFFEFGQPPPAVTRNAWVEIARTTLGAPTVTGITLPTFVNKRYLMLLVHLINNTGGGTGPEEQYRFNGDTGSNYASKNSNNGAIDSNVANQNVGHFSRTNGFNDKWIVAYINNNPIGEKMVIGHDNFHVTPLVVYPGIAPDRNESVSKWSNTLDPITDLQVGNITGNIAGAGIGSEAVLLGFDPADGLTDTANFWQSLASVELSAPADIITAIFPARKYLWIQYYFTAVGGTIEINERFNADAGNNYASRRSVNEGAEVLATNNDKIDVQSGIPVDWRWWGEQFIINKQDEQKLVHEHDGSEPAPGGPGTAPSRQEIVAVWDNVASQITQIDINNLGGGDYGIGSSIKVWGHD